MRVSGQFRIPITPKVGSVGGPFLILLVERLISIVNRDAPDTEFADIRPAGYPAVLKAGYRISGLLEKRIVRSVTSHKDIASF